MFWHFLYLGKRVSGGKIYFSHRHHCQGAKLLWLTKHLGFLSKSHGANNPRMAHVIEDPSSQKINLYWDFIHIYVIPTTASTTSRDITTKMSDNLFEMTHFTTKRGEPFLSQQNPKCNVKLKYRKSSSPERVSNPQ